MVELRLIYVSNGAYMGRPKIIYGSISYDTIQYLIAPIVIG